MDFISVFLRQNLGNGLFGKYFYIFLSAFIHKAVYDALRRVAFRKNSVVIFYFEGYAVFFVPIHGVPRLEFCKHAEELLISTRVELHEFSRVKAGVGNIASAAA